MILSRVSTFAYLFISAVPTVVVLANTDAEFSYDRPRPTDI
jgi:hypothetical protein